MASTIDICNQALSHLGDSATVASIEPPEGSAQAEHCARFYPLALSTLLEMHDWSFATRREPLALLLEATPQWLYAYQKPSISVRVLSVYNVDGSTDQPSDYVEELGENGEPIIRTNQENAGIHHTVYVSDSTKFSPLFTRALGWMLASQLAGPLLKGNAGIQATETCMKSALYWFGLAAASDANQSMKKTEHKPDWLAAR